MAALEQHLAQQVQTQVAAQVQAQLAAAAHPQLRPPQGKLHSDAGYNGNAALDQWLNRMVQLTQFYGLSTDAQRVHYAAAHLSGAALQWWLSLAPPQQPPSTWVELVSRLRQRFQPITSAETARARLRELRQGKATVQAYVATFNALLAHVPTMGEDDRIFAFVAGLSDRVRAHVDEMAHTSLQAAIERAVRFGSRAERPAAFAAASSAAGAPMELDALGIAAMGCESSAAEPTADAAPVTRAEFQQLLAAMRDSRSSHAGSARGGRGGQGGRSFRGPPRIAHLSEQQVKEYMDKGMCFGCKSTEHRSRECPRRKVGDDGRVSWTQGN